jgi:D-alanine-D-alanine ligase
MRMAVICGGRSPEHAVSVVSARSILREADPERFEVIPFGITRGGRWLTPDETRARLDAVEAGETDTLGEDTGSGVLGTPEVLEALADIDVVFPIVHGRMGEDGTLQGL